MTVTRVVTVWCDTDQCEAKAPLVGWEEHRPAGWRRMGARDFCPACSERGPSFQPDQVGMLEQCREHPRWVRARNGGQMTALAELFEFGGLLERREYKTKTGAPRFEYKAKP